jgi:Xaa-Pro aminopeptidase
MKNSRIETLQKRLSEWNIEALLIENPIDLLYLTGLKLSRGRLWVRHGDIQLHVDGRYFGEASQKSPCPVLLWEKGKEPKEKGTIGFDSGWTTVANLEKMQQESPAAVFVPIFQPLKAQRMIKDESEIGHLRRAAQITWQGIQHIQTLFRVGVSEQELALEFEFHVRKLGASGMAFEPIVAFGENSAYPHHRASDIRLKKDQIILVDVGAVYEQYCSDATRFFFFGQPDPELERMAQIVRQADRAARAKVRIGSKIGSIDRAARDELAKSGVEALFTHSLGHGIGLEAHECPLIRWDGDDRDVAILPHMAISIEPGLYRPGLGGVRYENTGVVTQKGFESFYPDS